MTALLTRWHFRYSWFSATAGVIKKEFSGREKEFYFGISNSEHITNKFRPSWLEFVRNVFRIARKTHDSEFWNVFSEQFSTIPKWKSILFGLWRLLFASVSPNSARQSLQPSFIVISFWSWTSTQFKYIYNSIEKKLYRLVERSRRSFVTAVFTKIDQRRLFS